MKSIKICMLGEFTIQFGENILRESGTRSRRIFSLLSFLICHRGQTVSQYRLIEHLWGSSAEIANPENTLRILMHRARNQLDQLYDGAGHACILRKDGGYCWNPEIPLELDYERFESLCQNASENQDRLASMMDALSLYRGEFLIRQSSDTWVIPLSTHFQNLFLTTSLEAAQLLRQQQRYSEAVQICRRCISADAYFEPICQILMQVLADMGDSQGAAEVYDSLSRRLFDDFGIYPSQETRAIYRSTVHSPENSSFTMEEVLEHLQEPDTASGALQCDYDYFKMLCYAERRAIERSGAATHVALLSVASPPEKQLCKRSISRIMDQLGQTLRTNLRRGDIISRCSTTQYILMLPKANYENSCIVCRRCIAAFQRSHPHVSARIHYLVQPLSPSHYLP